jgi:hypothetical protein
VYVIVCVCVSSSFGGHHSLRVGPSIEGRVVYRVRPIRKCASHQPIASPVRSLVVVVVVGGGGGALTGNRGSTVVPTHGRSAAATEGKRGNVCYR